LNPTSIVKPCLEKTYQSDDIFCCFDQNEIDNFSPEMLSAGYWQKQEAIIGTAQGRGTTYFVAHHQQQWVLKHYYRGGLVGKIITDSYWFTGYKNTRAGREFLLLNTLAKLGLPAPKPIAYKIAKSALTYRADILTSRINHAQDLVAILSKQTITADVWGKIGACIKSFHHHGIYHHDLNAHNILIDDDEKVWLIDFDRGEQRQPAHQWQQANLDRLLRSFLKEQQKLTHFHWHEDNWQLLLEGYLKASLD